MAKHHKKTSLVQQQKLLTAHQRKEFFRRFENLLYVLSGSRDVYNSLNDKILELIYINRCAAPKVSAAPGQPVDEQDLKLIKQWINYYLHENSCVVNDKGDEILLTEYCTAGLTLYSSDLKIEAFKFASAYQEIVKIFKLRHDIPDSVVDSPVKSLQRIGFLATLLKSSFKSNLYWSILKSVNVPGGLDPNKYIKFEINCCRQEKKKLLLDDCMRPTVRVGWGFNDTGMEWCSRSVDPFTDGIGDQSEALPVYIQMHALDRLEERMDCENPAVLHFHVFQSVSDCNIIKGFNNNYLIEYKYIDRKTGYLSAIIQDGKLIIRTFLFLTNNGTPEGRLLHKLTGLQKLDKQFLSIDKQSTFLDPEIRKNQTIRHLFNEAGCGQLFEMTVKDVFNPDVQHTHVSSIKMMNYMKLEPKENEAWSAFLAGGM